MSKNEESAENPANTAEDKEEKDSDDDKLFRVDHAKSGRAKCKKCKQPITTGSLRLAKIAFNPFGTGKINLWYHIPCMFEAFQRQRANTPKIENVEDVVGWLNITSKDQEEILNYLPPDARKHWNEVKGTLTLNDTPKHPERKRRSAPSPQKKEEFDVEGSAGRKVHKDKSHTSILPKDKSKDKFHKDNSFRQFRVICFNLANEPSYNQKTAILRNFFQKGSDGNGFRGDLYLWCKLLLPGAVRRIYNLQSKQLVKLFSRLFEVSHDEMLEDLEQGDVAETIKIFFEKSQKCKPAKSSTLSLYEVDEFLEQLSALTREEEQLAHFSNICGRCTANDLQVLVRLIKHDLRINAGPKHILDAVDEDAYKAFQTSRNLEHVIQQALSSKMDTTTSTSRGVTVSISLLTPILPMLAEPCKSLEYAMSKCPNGMFAEVKYDGERVQLHKKGNNFKFFSRTLKPVLPHKVSLFEAHIPHAFPKGNDLILDTEVLMVDTKTGKPLPFGSLGIHKKNEFKYASACLIVFDCLYLNGISLLDRPLMERKAILESNIVEIKNHVMLPEMYDINKLHDLEKTLTRVLKEGLEGLVLKDKMGIYEPGKRRWLKVKKDYLYEGKLADTADLVVLGAWYGTGSKGGMMSIFLMGCYDPDNETWVTVTKVHGGHDDKTLEKLQEELDVIKISRDPEKVPKWLKCKKSMIPDFVARNPKKMPVWEIGGAEFSQSDVHTANGISIRFPRVMRIRDDKTWETATTLPELMVIYERSKEYAKFELRRKRSPSPAKKQVKKVKASADSSMASTMEDNRRGPIKPLPDLFNGIRMFFPEDDVSDLRRYFIAYGGEDLPAADARKATHSLISVTPKDKMHGTKVSVSWLWDSIYNKRLQKETRYVVD